MATNFNNYVRLPPDSTGKRLHSGQLIMLSYNAASGSFNIYDIIVGETSGVTGEIVYIKEATVTAGTIGVLLSFDVVATQFTSGENLKVDGVTIALADDTGVLIHNQYVHIAGANNPLNGQFVDSFGAAYVRFQEGAQQLDAFGLSRFTSPTPIGSYSFSYGKDTDDFDEKTSGAGLVLDDLDQAAVRLQVDDTAGDLASYSSRAYHLYQPGYGQLTEMTIACGDTGKSGLVRRWGYFDDENGVFFKLEDSTLSVVIRSTTGTSTTETVISQSSWNGDKADGGGGLDNLSLLNLDVTKLSIYWIDFQWLGAGQVRFGTYNDNTRIVLHSEYNTNRYLGPYMRTGSLPVRVEIENLTATASPSILKFVCASVKTEGIVIQDFAKRTKKSSIVLPKTNISGETYLASFKSTTYLNGLFNRKASVPEYFNFCVGNNPVIIRIYKYAEVSGASYSNISGSVLDVDTSGNLTSGHLMVAFFVYPGEANNIKAPDNFGTSGEHLRLNAYGDIGDVYAVTAENVSGTDADVLFGMTWVDVG